MDRDSEIYKYGECSIADRAAQIKKGFTIHILTEIIDNNLIIIIIINIDNNLMYKVLDLFIRCIINCYIK